MNRSKMGEPRQGLLDRLAEISKLLYLSDLRTAWSSYAVLTALSSISAEEYPAEEWNQAITYIIYDEAGFQDPAEAKDYLIKQLKQKKEYN